MPAPTPYAAVHETHAGVVVLLGDRAYKYKKPVDLGFLDFTELADRQAVCRREVELNRRMSPDIYLGVSRLHQPDGTSEPVVTMRRMDPAGRLSTLVRSGVPVDDDLRDLARQLAALHLRSAHNAQIDREGGAERLLERWADSFEVVRRHAGTVVDADTVAEIETLVRRYLAGRGDLFAERIRTGCIVDGHGDLIADDIYRTPEGTRALDCLEFDDRLRYLDRIDDAAFLAMDLERLGAAKLGRRFLAWYREFAGDNAPPSLVAHYLAYRAFVRVKVECVRHDQGDPDAAARGRRLAEITLDHLREHAVTLTLVGGAPGTGKSTVAAALADRFGLTLASSDRLRKEQAGLAPERRSAASWKQGLYSPAWTRVTYNGIVDRAAALLRRGESVVLDATWSDQAQRTAARDVARRTHAELVEFRTTCDPALARPGSPAGTDPPTRTPTWPRGSAASRTRGRRPWSSTPPKPSRTWSRSPLRPTSAEADPVVACPPWRPTNPYGRSATSQPRRQIMTNRPVHFPHSTRTWNGRNLAIMLAVLLGVVLALAVAGRAQAATSAGDYGQHVVVCAQEHGFTGDHNPGMHRGRSGWDPTHIC